MTVNFIGRDKNEAYNERVRKTKERNPFVLVSKLSEQHTETTKTNPIPNDHDSKPNPHANPNQNPNPNPLFGLHRSNNN